MYAHRKARRYAGKLERRFEECLLQRLAVKGIVPAALLATGFVEPYRLILVVAVIELASKHAPGTHKVTVLPESFINDIEAIAAPQIRRKVDIGGEHIDQLACHA